MVIVNDLGLDSKKLELTRNVIKDIINRGKLIMIKRFLMLILFVIITLFIVIQFRRHFPLLQDLYPKAGLPVRLFLQ